MSFRTRIFFGFFSAFLIVLAFYFYFYFWNGRPVTVFPRQLTKASDNPVKFNAEEFKLPENVNSRGLNLIFLADQYLSWKEFENDINALTGELKTIEPWRSYQFFNIYKINPKELGLCYVKIKNERKPTLRCQSEINNYLNNLPLENFRLIVLSRQEFQSWANVVRLKNSGIFFSAPAALKEKSEQRVNALLLAHLLGHTFGLKDEEIFVLARDGGAPHASDGPNCAPDAATAEKWWGDLTKKYPEVGYFKGCAGNENYIKPTVASIMNLNTGAPIVYSYGPVSENYLKKVLNYCFTSDSFNRAKADWKFFEQYPEFKECLE